MAFQVVFAPEAEAHLVATYRYLASAASPEIAERFTESIVEHCEGFAMFPYRGTRRDDLRQGLRTVGFRHRVTIAFAVDGETVTIIGIFYGGQDFEPLLQAEE